MICICLFQAHLEAIVGVLGAIVATLILIIAGGVWCICSQDDGQQKVDFDHVKEVECEGIDHYDHDEDEDDDDEPHDTVTDDVVEDVSQLVTSTDTVDMDPMLV